MINTHIAQLKSLLQNNLPGEKAQLKMAPPGRKLHAPNKDRVRQSAVLLLLWEEMGEIYVTLTIRPATMKNHPNQISFPGGGHELTDFSLRATAIRETEEEVGVTSDSYKIIGKLTPLYVSVSNYCIKPYVAIATKRPKFVKNIDEVVEILTPPLSIFEKQETKSIFVVDTDTGPLEVPYFLVENKKLWGATAMILNELLEILKCN